MKKKDADKIKAGLVQKLSMISAIGLSIQREASIAAGRVNRIQSSRMFEAAGLLDHAVQNLHNAARVAYFRDVFSGMDYRKRKKAKAA